MARSCFDSRRIYSRRIGNENTRIMKKAPEEIARNIFDAYNAMDEDTSHMTVNAEEAHTLAMAFCDTVRELELVNQMLVDNERTSLASRSRIDQHMRKIGA